MSDITETPMEIGFIQQISGGGFEGSDGWWLGLGDATAWAQVGHEYKTWGDGIGRPVRGLMVDGKIAWYRTPEEQAEKHRQEIAAMKAKQLVDFEAKKEGYFARIEALPDVFKQRMQKFQMTNAEFDIEYGEYELFCCEQAVIVAEILKTADAIDDWWALNSAAHGYDWKAQHAMVPGWSDDHSGNTAGCAMMLAKAYVTDPEFVIKQHGALTPLVGCEAYGCPHDSEQP